jgi:hypothetical protein
MNVDHRITAVIILILGWALTVVANEISENRQHIEDLRIESAILSKQIQNHLRYNHRLEEN